jgi:hypothetical protein
MRGESQPAKSSPSASVSPSGQQPNLEALDKRRIKMVSKKLVFHHEK